LIILFDRLIAFSLAIRDMRRRHAASCCATPSLCRWPPPLIAAVPRADTPWAARYMLSPPCRCCRIAAAFQAKLPCRAAGAGAVCMASLLTRLPPRCYVMPPYYAFACGGRYATRHAIVTPLRHVREFADDAWWYAMPLPERCYAAADDDGAIDADALMAGESAFTLFTLRDIDDVTQDMFTPERRVTLPRCHIGAAPRYEMIMLLSLRRYDRVMMILLRRCWQREESNTLRRYIDVYSRHFVRAIARSPPLFAVIAAFVAIRAIDKIAVYFRYIGNRYFLLVTFTPLHWLCWHYNISYHHFSFSSISHYHFHIFYVIFIVFSLIILHYINTLYFH